MTGLLPLVAISGPRAGRAPCARRRVTWTSGDPLRILRPRESSQLEVIRPDAGPRCARGPQHPRATHGASTHEASALDGGHGRPGMAEPAGSGWGGKRPPASGTANAAPPGRARPSARKPRPGVAAAASSPRRSRVPPPATPRAAGAQTALGRADLGAAVSHTFARSSRARWPASAASGCAEGLG